MFAEAISQSSPCKGRRLVKLAMSPKKALATGPKKPSLKEYAKTLTEEEVSVAEASLKKLEADKASKRRMEASMTYYLKQSGEDDGRCAGQKRRDFMIAFIAKKGKESGAFVQSEAEHVVEEKTTKGLAKGWMSLKKIEDEFGVKKAHAWVASGKLTRQADKITGSEEDDMAEFWIEQEYEDEQGVDMQKIGIKTQKTLDDEDSMKKQRDAIQDMASSLCARLGIASSSSDPGGPVKNEKDGVDGNPLDKLDIMKDKNGLLRKLKDLEFTAKVYKTDAEKVQYATALSNDLSSFLPKIGGAIKAMEKLALADSTTVLDFEEVKQLDTKIKLLQEKFVDMKTWAVKFGFAKQNKRARKA